MKNTFNLFLLALPLAATVACGKVAKTTLNFTEEEQAIITQVASSDENDEILADHVEEMSAVLALDDDSTQAGAGALGLAQSKESDKESSCSISEGVLVYKKSQSRERELDKATKKGRVERSSSSSSSSERRYSPAAGGELAMYCASASGPVKLIAEKIEKIAGMKVEATHSNKSESSLKIDGAIKNSRSVYTQGSRQVTFGAGILSSNQITLSKTIQFSSSSDVSKVAEGKTSALKNSRETLPEAPLQVEVLRDGTSKKLLHTLIKTGHVVIKHGDALKTDIVYENVKFVEECKPVSGRLLVSKVNPGEATAKSISVVFKEDGAYVSRNGGEEKKMESINLRLEGCKK